MEQEGDDEDRRKGHEGVRRRKSGKHGDEGGASSREVNRKSRHVCHAPARGEAETKLQASGPPSHRRAVPQPAPHTREKEVRKQAGREWGRAGPQWRGGHRARHAPSRAGDSTHPPPMHPRTAAAPRARFGGETKQSYGASRVGALPLKHVGTAPQAAAKTPAAAGSLWELRHRHTGAVHSVGEGIRLALSSQAPWDTSKHAPVKVELLGGTVNWLEFNSFSPVSTNRRKMTQITIVLKTALALPPFLRQPSTRPTPQAQSTHSQTAQCGYSGEICRDGRTCIGGLERPHLHWMM